MDTCIYFEFGMTYRININTGEVHYYGSHKRWMQSSVQTISRCRDIVNGVIKDTFDIGVAQKVLEQFNLLNRHPVEVF